MVQRLTQLLLDDALLSRAEADAATEEARSTGAPLHDVLLRRRSVDEDALLHALGRLYGLPVVSLREEPIEPAAVNALSAKFVAHYGVMPVRAGSGSLTLAVADPLDLSAAEDIEAHRGVRVDRVLARRDEIAEATRRHYGVGADTVERLLDTLPADAETRSAEPTHDLETMAEDASVVRLVNQLLQQAIQERTTDIHFEMHRSGMVARRRIDGVLYDTQVPARIRHLYPAIVSRIKLMSGLNIVERRLPQDGRSRVHIGSDEFDLRVSVVPSLHGEDIVIRILPTSMLFSIEKLGLSTDHHAHLLRLIEEPHGIVFVTGPTGSGKSTTLYACLSRLNQRERKVITIEDPVEYELPGITQTQINPKIGLSFARSLRSMLRHDPDVMMVGEVRDPETAEIAVQTAMTGHLVLSTLHTNDAASGAVRLMDMGIDPYLVTSTVRAFVAQRLVRTICSQCRESYEENGRTLYRGTGCRQCHQTGYEGRVAICEILDVDAEVEALIHARASASEIKRHAVAHGMRTLAQDGEDKVSRGVTTLEEVLRVTRL